MYNQNDSQFNETAQSSNNIWAIIVPVVITALVVGGGVYAWQRSNLKSTEQNLQQQIENLQNQLDQFRQAEVNQDQQKNVNNLITGESQNQNQGVNISTPAQNEVATQPVTQSEIPKNVNNISTSVYADWKTYTNKKMGFRIKYPQEWAVIATDPQDELYVGFDIVKNKDSVGFDMGYKIPGITINHFSKTASQYLESIQAPTQKIIQKENVIIEDKIFVKILVRQFGGDKVDLLYEKNDSLFLFTATALTSDNYLMTLESMLHTLEFIE